MNFLKIFALLFLCFVFSQQTHCQTPGAKNYKLIVNLDKAPFDSLYLHDYTDGRHVLIAGKKTKEFTWEITIPDSIVSDSENMQLLASPYKAASNSSAWVRFINNKAGKEIVVANVGVDDENSYIYGTYLRKTVFANESMSITKSNKDTVVSVIRGSKDKDIVGNLICEDFSVIARDPNSDLAVRAEDPFFSWFIGPDGNGITYDDGLASYIELAKKHPDSWFPIISLANNLTKYHSKNDVKKVYENFSGKHKNTIWAKKIERYLSESKFQNAVLPTLRKKAAEKIVQDASKYNLVIFTASWCGPCREEIPLLKKIHKDLGKNLILTYVSIDEAQSVAAMQKLIRETQIPWRTLFAYRDVKKIKQKYFIEGIPQNTLIYPNQDTEKIDVRKDEDREKLYALVKALENQKRAIR